MSKRDELLGMTGLEWPVVVGEIWESHRSRFSTPWDDLSHHDQVAVFRILLSDDAL